MQERMQRWGGFMAGMVIPNIAAFIAWGLITAFFIPTGWTPSENLAKLVGPMIVYLLPIPIEVGKVLFLNNAINHGILAPLGVQTSAQAGKAIHFLLETNPGPGLGLLLAYWMVGKGSAKQSAPGAIIIHFFGGIHEIYFPYVLMHPIMIVAMWAGGIAADIVFVLTGAGLVAPPSPGSIFAESAMTPRGGHVV